VNKKFRIVIKNASLAARLTKKGIVIRNENGKPYAEATNEHDPVISRIPQSYVAAVTMLDEVSCDRGLTQGEYTLGNSRAVIERRQWQRQGYTPLVLSMTAPSVNEAQQLYSKLASRTIEPTVRYSDA
jgi:hypothetical protein